jgi:hypothetical protein
MPYAALEPTSDIHEEFLKRAARVFPVEASRGWSKLERAVFNVLIGELIYQHGYKHISDEMLAQACAEMSRIVNMKNDPTCAPRLPDRPAADRASAGRMAGF